MSARTRIFAEFLAPELLGDDATLRLLERRGIEPVIAVPPEAETPALGSAIQRLGARGIPIGLWPLMSDREGYWLNVENAAQFQERAEAALAFFQRHQVWPSSFVFDLEPPLLHTQKLFGRGKREGLRYLLGSALTRQGRRDLGQARQALDRLGLSLRDRGVETLATILPPLLFDLDQATPFTQAMLHTPVERQAVDRLCPMAYTTMIAPMLGLGRPAAQRLVYLMGRALIAEVGRRQAALALGLVGPGKLGDEPHYEGPEALAEDVAAARASGIGDLSVFSLEGILAKPHPEVWLDALRAEPKTPPPHLRLDAAMAGLKSAAGLLSSVYRLTTSS
ncbi:MAG: hypothetical protein U1E65_12160 [Myxococcota bacterium]